MEIIESWENHNSNSYAIVRYSEEEQRKYGDKTYEAMWLDDMTSTSPELHSFGGTVGYTTAHFDMIEEAQDFSLKGISEEDTNPDIWFDMLVMSSQRE